MDKLKSALFRRDGARERGILLRQHGGLDFARHVEVFLHQQVFGVQLPAAAGQFGIGPADLFLGEFLRGDVPENALQTDDAAVRAVERRFDDLNDGSLLSQRLMFLDDFVGLAGFHHAAVVLLVFFGQFLRKKIEIRFAEDVLQRAFVMFAVLLVGEREPPLQVLSEPVDRQYQKTDRQKSAAVWTEQASRSRDDGNRSARSGSEFEENIANFVT